MISADRLAELQQEAADAGARYDALQADVSDAGAAASASVGTDEQGDRFNELMNNYARYTGTLDINTYARLQAQRAVAGMPTEEQNRYTQVAWESEKARRTAEDPTWNWRPCKLGPEIYELDEGDPEESYEAFLERATASGAFRNTQADMDAEGPVDPRECARRQQAWTALLSAKRFYERERRYAESMDPLSKGLIKAGDFLVSNVFGSLPVVGQVVGEAYKAIQKYQPASKFYDARQARKGFDVGKFVADTAIGSIKNVGGGKIKAYVKGKAVDAVKTALRPHTNTIRALTDRIARPLSSVRNLQRRN
jgi:hypothetical protein